MVNIGSKGFPLTIPAKTGEIMSETGNKILIELTGAFERVRKMKEDLAFVEGSLNRIKWDLFPEYGCRFVNESGIKCTNLATHTVFGLNCCEEHGRIRKGFL